MFGAILFPSSGTLDCVLQLVVRCTHDVAGQQHRGCIIPQAQGLTVVHLFILYHKL